MTQVVNTRGRTAIEAIIEMVVIIAVAPAIVCCVVQAVTMIAAIALPWAALTVIVVGVTACLAAVFVAGGAHGPHLRPRGPAGGGDGDNEPVLPIRRPPALPGPGERHER